MEKKRVSRLGLKKLPSSYEPKCFESLVETFWEKTGCFEVSDQAAQGKKVFSIVLPPPNVTGVLHMGHALINTIQDILVRWHRMRGAHVLWLPGTDHAGIATQIQVERMLAQKKGPSGKPLTRYDLGRERFLKEVWKWKKEHGEKINEQMKVLGSSLDWRRERFTLDQGSCEAVQEAFVRLYRDGLLYRGPRVIHWCTRCHTALSDLEVVLEERVGRLWYLRYLLLDERGKVVRKQGSESFDAEALVVATTRPETLLGDTAVAIHPKDERYQKFHGKKVQLPLLDRAIPVILDTYVDRAFGTGALKITPAHDFYDFEIGTRHHLPNILVIGKDGYLNQEAGPYRGLGVLEARKRVLEDLEKKGLLIKEEKHVHQVGVCARCKHTVEPLLSTQWFVRTATLAKKAVSAVKQKKTRMIPKSWEKTYFEWMENIRDWCISRQLWWGHRIPAWFCKSCDQVTVDKKAPKKCTHCGGKELFQDEDVLDTWFSSALWPFSTLGWPKKTKALQTFYPTSVLETGFDILFFWVARMMMMGLYFMKQVPFRWVYLHAMVRDEKGQKMSKTRGNVVDPLEIVNEHGVDPLRFTLAIMAGQGRDIKLSRSRMVGYRAFCNKLWNAKAFFDFQMKNISPKQRKDILKLPQGGLEKWIEKRFSKLSKVHQWILTDLQNGISEVNQALKEFKIHVYTQTLYDFVWHQFCDWYLEWIKLEIRAGEVQRREALWVYLYVFESVLKLLHPVIPFVTEVLYQTLSLKKPIRKKRMAIDTSYLDKTILKKNKSFFKKETLWVESLSLQVFPLANKKLKSLKVKKEIQRIQSLIASIRNFRGENQLSFRVKLPIKVVTCSQKIKKELKQMQAVIEALAGVSIKEFIFEKKSIFKKEKKETPVFETVLFLEAEDIELRISLENILNPSEEIHRIEKEIQKAEKVLARVTKKLQNESFLKRAPHEIVQKEKRKKESLNSSLKKFFQTKAQFQVLLEHQERIQKESLEESLKT